MGQSRFGIFDVTVAFVSFFTLILDVGTGKVALLTTAELAHVHCFARQREQNYCFILLLKKSLINRIITFLCIRLLLA